MSESDSRGRVSDAQHTSCFSGGEQPKEEQEKSCQSDDREEDLFHGYPYECSLSNIRINGL